MDKLKLHEASAYLPYNVGIIQKNDQHEIGWSDGKHLILTEVTDSHHICFFLMGRVDGQWTETSTHVMSQFKLKLRPLSDLLKEIDLDGEQVIPIDLFEIGEEPNEAIEYDHGNIKLINLLTSIAENNCYHDINFLPYPVVQQLLRWHFDIFNLIGRGLAITI